MYARDLDTGFTSWRFGNVLNEADYGISIQDVTDPNGPKYGSGWSDPLYVSTEMKYDTTDRMASLLSMTFEFDTTTVITISATAADCKAGEVFDEATKSCFFDSAAADPGAPGPDAAAGGATAADCAPGETFNEATGTCDLPAGDDAADASICRCSVRQPKVKCPLTGT